MSEAGKNYPSLGQDPADDGSLGGAFRAIFRKMLQSVDGMLPATVIAVEPDRKYAKVRPQIQVKGTSGELKTRGQIARVPVFNIGAGGFVLSFPIKPEDRGWIIASDRDISLYQQTGKEAAPNTNRLHSFEDGLFIPDAARDFVLADTDADNAVWQTLDALAKISLGAGKIQLTHDTLVEIVCAHVTVKGGDLKVEKGIAAWDHAVPSSQPAITGALSAVSDTNAKNVLTSIIAVLVGAGFATNGTT